MKKKTWKIISSILNLVLLIASVFVFLSSLILDNSYIIASKINAQLSEDSVAHLRIASGMDNNVNFCSADAHNGYDVNRRYGGKKIKLLYSRESDRKSNEMKIEGVGDVNFNILSTTSHEYSNNFSFYGFSSITGRDISTLNGNECYISSQLANLLLEHKQINSVEDLINTNLKINFGKNRSYNGNICDIISCEDQFYGIFVCVSFTHISNTFRYANIDLQIKKTDLINCRYALKDLFERYGAGDNISWNLYNVSQANPFKDVPTKINDNFTKNNKTNKLIALIVSFLLFTLSLVLFVKNTNPYFRSFFLGLSEIRKNIFNVSFLVSLFIFLLLLKKINIIFIFDYPLYFSNPIFILFLLILATIWFFQINYFNKKPDNFSEVYI